jgi:hypothetical protein
MALWPCKTEGGQGGKRGHSNMSHWTRTAEYKDSAKRRRRLERRLIGQRALREL